MPRKSNKPHEGAAPPVRAEQPMAPAELVPSPPSLSELVPPPLRDEEATSTCVFVSLQVPWVNFIVRWARARRRC
jgi:hypothetical protein